MLKTLLITLTLLFLGVSPPADASSQQGTTMVYISTGKYAKSYHATDRCYTIRRCGSEGHVKRVSLVQAQQMGRKPCKVCYY